MLTHVDLFSGIGGFSIAAKAAGFTTVAFAETDPDARAVLNYWWPRIPNVGDVNQITGGGRRYYRPIDLLTGGVPCQPTSHVGLMRGTSDPRWMWPAAIRAMRIFRPRVAVYENPPALLILEQGRAFNGIVSEMVALGYDLWWDIFPAAAFGAGHLRERLIIVATDANGLQDSQHRESRDSNSSSGEATESRLSGRSIPRSNSQEQATTNTHGERGQQESRGSPSHEGAHGLRPQDDHEPARLEQATPNTDSKRWAQAREQCLLEGSAIADDLRRQSTSSTVREVAPDAKSAVPTAGLREGQPEQSRRGSSNAGSEAPPDAQRPRLQGHERLSEERPGPSSRLRSTPPSDLRGRVSKSGPNGEDWWSEVVTGIPVLAHGLPNKLVEAISRCTGNAVVPQTLVPLLTAIRDMI